MKWIGQHIWDFISRFRSDVYLESTETGTIASGGNLGLDSNNKIVKSASPSGTLPVSSGGTGATSLANNSVLTGGATAPITAESTLIYGAVANTLKIGGDDAVYAQITRANHTSDDGGDLIVTSGSPSFIPGSTNKTSGDLILRTGYSTGDNTGGSIKLRTVQAVNASGSGMNVPQDTVTVHRYNVHLEEDVTLSFEGASDGDYETTLTVADPSADRTITLPNATGTVALTSDIPAATTVGWHGSATTIKILHSDFSADDGGRPVMIDDVDEANENFFLETHGTFKAYATIAIPTGYKATHVMVYGTNTPAIEVWEHQINSKTGVSKGTGNVDTAIDITDVNSTATNYLLIQVAQASGDEIHGGYVTIATI